MDSGRGPGSDTARGAAVRAAGPLRERGGPLLRLGFLVALGGGLLLWSQLRKPRDCEVALDLTRVLPGEVAEVDLIVRRDGTLLERKDVRFGAAGAPATVRATVHARPGDAELEATVLYAREVPGQPPAAAAVPKPRAARRTLTRVRLDESAPATVVAE